MSPSRRPFAHPVAALLARTFLRRAALLALLLAVPATVTAGEPPGALQRAGAAVERGAQRTGAAVSRGAERTGAALQRAGAAVGRGAHWTARKLGLPAASSPAPHQSGTAGD